MRHQTALAANTVSHTATITFWTSFKNKCRRSYQIAINNWQIVNCNLYALANIHRYLGLVHWKPFFIGWNTQHKTVFHIYSLFRSIVFLGYIRLPISATQTIDRLGLLYYLYYYVLVYDIICSALNLLTGYSVSNWFKQTSTNQRITHWLASGTHVIRKDDNKRCTTTQGPHVATGLPWQA